MPPPLHQRQTGAGDRDRTGIISLEGWGSTIELHPLCQVHTNQLIVSHHTQTILVEGVGFEPT